MTLEAKKGSSVTACLARRKPTTKPKGALGAKAGVKHKVSLKSKLRGAYLRRRKHKGKTHQKSIDSTIRNLEVQMGQLAKQMTERPIWNLWDQY